MITKEVSNYFADAFVYFNKHLFSSTLPNALITISRKKSAFGFFSPACLVSGDSQIDEIAFTSDALSRSTLQNLSTLVHEQVHQWQHHFGKPGKNGYHNKQWAKKMHEIGLKPLSYDHPLLETGFRCSHEIIDSGRFFEVANKFIGIQGELPVKTERSFVYGVKSIRHRPRLLCPLCSQALSIPHNLNVAVFCKSCNVEMETQNEI